VSTICLIILYICNTQEDAHYEDWLHYSDFRASCHSMYVFIREGLTIAHVLLPLFEQSHNKNSIALVDVECFFSFLVYTQSVGLLGRGSAPSQDRYLHTQYKHIINVNTDIHASSWIWTYVPSVQTGEDGSRLRRRSHCDRLWCCLRQGNIPQNHIVM
jgi:hypothetical protein